MTISLRNLPPDVKRAITEKSKKEGTSLNRATIRLLEASVGGAAPNSDFEEFFGRWPKREADSFDRKLRRMRRIDPSDWE